MADDILITLTADIVSAHVSNNSVGVADLPTLIERVYGALAKTGAPVEAEASKLTPAVPIRSSVKPDYLVCLEDGKKMKMLKRHLATSFNLTPDEYRAKWGLPKDYPMVAPNYSERRRNLARSIGLGRKSAAMTAAIPETIAAPSVDPVKRGRKKLGIAVGKSTASVDVSSVASTKPALQPARKPRGRAKSAAPSS